MSRLWSSHGGYFYLTQYHTKQIPSIGLPFILFMHLITEKVQVIHRAEHRYISVQDSSITHILHFGFLFHFSTAFLTQPENEINRCSQCCWAAGEGPLGMAEEWRLQPPSAQEGKEWMLFSYVPNKSLIWKMGSTTATTTPSPDMLWWKGLSLLLVLKE